MAQAAGLATYLAFRPQDRELIDLFLRPKLAGQPLHAGLIHDVDVYSAAPDKLVAELTSAPGTGDGDARVWYFFSPVHYVGGAKIARGGGPARKSRAVCADGNEFWHSETGPKPVKDSAAGGKFQKFSYKVKTDSGVVKPGWLMVEYSIDSQEHGGADLVLCKVYRSPRAPPSSRASSTTSAALSESGCKKRKAAGDHPEAPPPCSARRQTSDEEDDDVFAESLERALTSECHVPEDADDHHPAEASPCSLPWQMNEIEELLEIIEREGDLMSFFGLDQPDLMSDDGLDEPGAPPPAEPEPEPEPDKTTAVHGPCPDDALQVAAACLDEEEGEQLVLDDEPAPGEFIGGLPCPPFEPAYIEALLSASGDVVMPWPAVPAAVPRLCGGDHLSPAPLRTGSFGAFPAVC